MKITTIEQGNVFQDRYATARVLETYGDTVTMYLYGADCNRVEEMDYDVAIELLNALFNTPEDYKEIYPDDYEEAFRDHQDTYFCSEHPERKLVAAWPDDCDFYKLRDKYSISDAGYVSAFNIVTGEVYSELNDEYYLNHIQQEKDEEYAIRYESILQSANDCDPMVRLMLECHRRNWEFEYKRDEREDMYFTMILGNETKVAKTTKEAAELLAEIYTYR